MTLHDRLEALLGAYPEVLHGYADIAYSPYGREYPTALVLAVPYGRQLTPADYTEEAFEEGIRLARVRLEELAARLEELLRQEGTAYFVPPVAQRDETELLAPFSFKYAATRAGLGWIGRNDVVITPRYGPRVRLGAILLDARLPWGQPTEKSRCPEGCSRCVEACPCKALRGVTWDAEKQRAELIDYHRCNRMRSAFIPRLGRKSACGLCLAACPFGTGEAPV